MKNVLWVTVDAPPTAGYAELLHRSGFDVRSADVSSVLPSLRTGILSADLLIVECRAFSRDIERWLHQLVKAFPAVPVVLVAGCGSVDSYLRSQALGIREYICAPVEDREILQVVQALTEREARAGKAGLEQHAGLS